MADINFPDAAKYSRQLEETLRALDEDQRKLGHTPVPPGANPLQNLEKSLNQLNEKKFSSYSEFAQIKALGETSSASLEKRFSTPAVDDPFSSIVTKMNSDVKNAQKNVRDAISTRFQTAQPEPIQQPIGAPVQTPQQPVSANPVSANDAIPATNVPKQESSQTTSTPPTSKLADQSSLNALNNALNASAAAQQETQTVLNNAKAVADLNNQNLVQSVPAVQSVPEVKPAQNQAPAVQTPSAVAEIKPEQVPVQNPVQEVPAVQSVPEVKPAQNQTPAVQITQVDQNAALHPVESVQFANPVSQLVDPVAQVPLQENSAQNSTPLNYSQPATQIQYDLNGMPFYQQVDGQIVYVDPSTGVPVQNNFQPEQTVSSTLAANYAQPTSENIAQGETYSDSSFSESIPLANLSDPSLTYDRKDIRSSYKRSVFARIAKDALIILVAAIVLNLIVSSFVLQPFNIPSGSMENTLQVNDTIVTLRLKPSLFSLSRGDIIVFKDTKNWLSTPNDTSTSNSNPLTNVLRFLHFVPDNSENYLVKRLIGMPGDHVSCKGGGSPIVVNGHQISESYLKSGVKPSDLAFDVVVPENALFVLGDNRSNSADSRYNTSKPGNGFVSEGDVVGVAFEIITPFSRFGSIADQRKTFEEVPKP